jgi:hypothetical protein
MDHVKILKRAWEILWRYRALWIFGIILALTTASGGPSSPSRGSGGGPAEYHLDEGDLPFPGGRLELPELSPQLVSVLIAVGVGIGCMIIFLIIATTVARYVTETALIRMVNDYEETGETQTIRQGFRIGWSRTALRLFLIDLLIGLPLAVVFILLFLLAAGPLLLWITESTAAGVIGTVVTIGMGVLVIFLAIVVGVMVSLLKHFFRRVCALEEAGVIESIRQGFDFVRRHLKDVFVMWLIMVGLNIGWAIALIVVTIALIPIIILLVIVGGVLGGIPALIVGGLASLFLEGAVPYILGALVGLPIFILVVAVPWLFLGGLMEVYKSSVWTLTYRELRALESVEPELPELGETPELDVPELE